LTTNRRFLSGVDILLAGSASFLLDFEATGIKKCTAAAAAGMAEIKISAGVSRRSAQKAANHMELNTFCSRYATTTRLYFAFRSLPVYSADNPSGASDVILNSDRHVFYLI
jgi:hypothetical protein